MVGLGAIGCRVAELSVALGMDVIAHNRTNRGCTGTVASVRRLPFAELLAESDIVSLHVASTPETRVLDYPSYRAWFSSWIVTRVYPWR